MKKIIKNIIAFCLIAALIFSISACDSIKTTPINSSTNPTADTSANYKKYSYSFFGTFDTVIDIVGYATSQEDFDKYTKHLNDRFDELHKLFDNYNTYEGLNNTKTINDNAGISPVEVDKTLIDLLSFCIDSYENVSSKTDVSIGSVLKIWHEYREAGLADPANASLPLLADLQAANAYTGIQNIVIDKENSTVYLEAGSLLDLGAIAKGYATELVANELIDMGLQAFYINGGGNVKAVGIPIDENKDTWNVALQNPFYFEDDTKGPYSDIAYINDMSVVTSGDYQRFYIVDGQSYHHLIDPQTLFPADYFRAVTIFTQDSGLADYLSTVLFLSTYEEGLALVEGIDGVDAYWIFADETVKATDGAKAILKSYMDATN